MAENKKLFTIFSESSSVSPDENIDVLIESSLGTDNSSQVPVEPERKLAVGVDVSPNDDRAPLVNAADQAEVTPAGRTTPVEDSTCCDRYTDWAEKVADSWMMLFVLILLLGGSITFIYMGASYYDQCPFYPHFPLMTIIMGSSSSFAICIRILRILKPCRGQPGHWFLRYLTNNGFLVFLVLFVVELCMYAFSDGYPSKTYVESSCDDTFFNFLKSSFPVVIVTVLLSGVIYGPLVHRFFKPLYYDAQAENYVD